MPDDDQDGAADRNGGLLFYSAPLVRSGIWRWRWGIAPVVRPALQLATTSWWAGTTLREDLGVAGASTDQVYAAMDRLLCRQDAIEARLAARHLARPANPDRMALFELTSAWGSH